MPGVRPGELLDPPLLFPSSFFSPPLPFSPFFLLFSLPLPHQTTPTHTRAHVVFWAASFPSPCLSFPTCNAVVLDSHPRKEAVGEGSMSPIWVAVTILPGPGVCGRSLSRLYRYPAVELLGHKRHGMSTQLNNTKWFSKMVVPIYSPICSGQEFLLLHILTNTSF